MGKRRSINLSGFKLLLLAGLIVALLYTFSSSLRQSLSQQQHTTKVDIILNDNNINNNALDNSNIKELDQSTIDDSSSTTQQIESPPIQHTTTTNDNNNNDNDDKLTAEEEQRIEADYGILDTDQLPPSPLPLPPPPPPSPSTKKHRQPKPHSHQQSANSSKKQQRSTYKLPDKLKKGNTIHVIMTSGGGHYQNYQSRVHYASFKNVQQQPGGERMVAFTRILHRTETDDLIHEIPTFLATPLQAKCTEWCEYPVSDRANAILQFFNASEKYPDIIKAPWVFLTETDYVWLKPLEAPMAEDPSSRPFAYQFGYIMPSIPNVAFHLQKLYVNAGNRKRGDANPDFNRIPRTGPAPALMRISEWKKVLPQWVRITAKIENDEDAKRELGWIREMYAFCVAADIENIDLDLRPTKPIMIQPPHENNLADSVVLIHYTWGVNITDANKTSIVWYWDKRNENSHEVEMNMPFLPELPSYVKGWKFDFGHNVTKEVYDVLSVFVDKMNGAIKTLPPHSTNIDGQEQGIAVNVGDSDEKSNDSNTSDDDDDYALDDSDNNSAVGVNSKSAAIDDDYAVDDTTTSAMKSNSNNNKNNDDDDYAVDDNDNGSAVGVNNKSKSNTATINNDDDYALDDSDNNSAVGVNSKSATIDDDYANDE